MDQPRRPLQQPSDHPTAHRSQSRSCCAADDHLLRAHHRCTRTIETSSWTGQLPPSQVITSISLFMTLFIMTPVWNEVYTEAIAPYTAEGSTMTMQEAWDAGIEPIHRFMSRQIDMAGNHDDVHLFYSYYQPNATPPSSFEEVPLRVLLPAYMLSELKTAFLMAFRSFFHFF